MEKLLPGVELQEIESELSSENGCTLKRSKQWHRPTGRRHHLAKVFHATLYLRCTTIVVERAYACIHTPANRERRKTKLVRDLPGKPGERRTRTHLLLSFLLSLPHQLPWQAPNLVNNSARPWYRNHCSCQCGAAQEQEALLCAMKQRQGCDCSL